MDDTTENGPIQSGADPFAAPASDPRSDQGQSMQWAQALQEPGRPVEERAYASVGATGMVATPLPPAAPPVSRRRRVWPWVVAGIVMFVVAGAGALGMVGARVHDVDLVNSDYVAEPVSEEDTAIGSGTLIVTEDATVAFETGEQWVEQPELGAQLEGALVTDSPLFTGAWYSTDWNTSDERTLVTVIVIKGRLPLTPLALKTSHAARVATFVQSGPVNGFTAQAGPTNPASTASGLDGLVTSVDLEFEELEGFDGTDELYTFARGNVSVYLEVVSYGGSVDPQAADGLLSSLRIEP